MASLVDGRNTKRSCKQYFCYINKSIPGLAKENIAKAKSIVLEKKIAFAALSGR